MARPIRVEFPGAVYHVVARGNERRPIFRDDDDRRRFLDTVADVVEDFGVVVHAYCLMLNHYHLILETPRGNLSRSVGWLQLTYTVRFNRRHSRDGHLFRGRFTARIVDADEYARWLVVYVHLNPVRPGSKQQPLDPSRAGELAAFPWSSHRDYAGLRSRPAPWLDLGWLRYWGRSRARARREYRDDVRRAFDQGLADPFADLRGGLVLGGERLWDTVSALVRAKTGESEAEWARTEEMCARRERVRRLVAGEPDRRIRIWARRRLGEERGSDLAREFGYAHASGVTHLLIRLDAEACRSQPLRERLASLREMSNVKS